uniref:Core Histone H2A/H2B/H3 domain-containing protein n=1 Tax=Kalanchoe fedtschenkoi TaxID=63787 RepID=A0A7N0V280_KALFE
MDQQSLGQSHMTASGVAAAPVAYVTPPYQHNQLTGPANPGPIFAPAPVYSQAAGQLAPHIAFQQINQQQQQQLQQQLQAFWSNQKLEIEKVTDFKNHSLPLARIKKIMKADEDVRMISAEAPIIFARACEMFILELTLRAWNHTEENKRRTLQKNDIAAAVNRTDIFDFLVDILPKEDLKDEALASIPRGPLPAGGPDMLPPYHYMPPQNMPHLGAPGMIMGEPVMDPSLYAHQPHPYMAPQMWPQAPQQDQSSSE